MNTNTEAAELLPCPFCGSSAKHGSGFSPMESIDYAWCGNNECHLHLIDEHGFTVEDWNTRAHLASKQTDAGIASEVIYRLTGPDGEFYFSADETLAEFYRTEPRHSCTVFTTAGSGIADEVRNSALKEAAAICNEYSKQYAEAGWPGSADQRKALGIAEIAILALLHDYSSQEPAPQPSGQTSDVPMPEPDMKITFKSGVIAKVCSLKAIKAYGDARVSEATRELVESENKTIEAFRELVDLIKYAPVASGVCCCGEPMDSLGTYSHEGHTPTDMWDHTVSSIIAKHGEGK